MPGFHRKGLANEIKYPHVVELAVGSGGLDVELSRRIMHFHKSRHLEPRCGRRITRGRNKHHYYRWCFSDLSIASAFAEQFGGELCKPSI